MANIRVDALTEVATIADDDVVMVDGKQGVRATTWGTLKNLIKQQCGINELNTNTKNLIWIRDYQTEHFSIPAGTAKSHETAAPAVEGYHPAGIVGIYHGNNNGDIVISKFYCKSDAGEIGVVVKNNGNVAANTALYFQIMYVKNL